MPSVSDTLRRHRGCFPLIGLAIAAVVAVVMLVRLMGGEELSGEMGSAQRVLEEYVAHLRAGRSEEARAMWTREQRTTPTPEQAERALSSPVRASDTTKQTEVLTTDTKACVVGGLAREGWAFDSVSHTIRLFLVKEEGVWRLHTAQLWTGSIPKPVWPASWHPKAQGNQSACGQGY